MASITLPAQAVSRAYGVEARWKTAAILMVLLTSVNIAFIYVIYRSMNAFIPFFILVNVVLVFSLFLQLKHRFGVILALFALYPLLIISEYRLPILGIANSSPFEIIGIIISLYYFINLKLSSSRLNLAIFILILLLLVNALFVPDNVGLFQYFGKFRRVLIPITFFAGLRIASSNMDAKFVKYSLFFLAIIYIIPCILGIIQFNTGTMFMTPEIAAEAEKEVSAVKYAMAQFIEIRFLLAKGLTSYANNFSYYLVFVFIAALNFVFGKDSLRPTIIRILFLALAIFIFYTLLLTFSRANIIFAVLSLGFFIVSMRVLKNVLLATIITTIIVVLGLSFVYFVIPKGELSSFIGRRQWNIAAISGLTDIKTLFFGQSLEAFRDRYGLVPHNLYLGFIYDNGIFISLIYFTVIFKSIIRSFKYYTRNITIFANEEKYIINTLITMLFYLLVLSGFNYYYFYGIERTLLTFLTTIMLENVVRNVARTSYNRRNITGKYLDT